MLVTIAALWLASKYLCISVLRQSLADLVQPSALKTCCDRVSVLLRATVIVIVASFSTLALSRQSGASDASQPVVVGSKRFTESYVLGEIVTQTLRAGGVAAEHRQGLGNTGILEQALMVGSVDLYPEYTGTIVRELLKRDGNPSLEELNRWLAPRRLKVAVPLGFNNSYALAMSERTAAARGIVNVSDLAKPTAAGLRFGLSHEFRERGDGWPALSVAYGLAPHELRSLDHGLAYDAIGASQVDVIDVYSTDAKVGRLGLRVLVDDRRFFPRYDAVLLMRADVDERPLQRLAGRIDNAAMTRMNGEVELDGRSFAEVASRFVSGESPGASASTSASASSSTSASPSAPLPPPTRQTFWQRLFAPDFARLAWEHLTLVLGSLALAIGAGVPIGVAAWRWPRLAAPLLGTVAILQTVPSLALLAFLIAWVGRIGTLPAVIALFLYALLPIVRNTYAGLQGVAPGLAQAALSLGLTPRQTLRLVQLPLAAPTLLAGVKTAAVINVGTATMAAFIGAGGFGERIVAGLAVNDNAAMLAGALPAAVLAIAIQLAFDGLERAVVPGGASRR